MVIPDDLIDQYKRGRVLIFIGQGINGPEWQQVASHLAARLQGEEVSAFSLPEIADEYRASYGAQALIQTVRDFYDASDEPRRGHKLLASLTGCKLFVTTCLDDRLERAFADVGRPLDRIIRQVDRAYSGPASAARLYKLHGTLGQPDTLVLTQQQIRDLYFHQTALSIALKGHLADNTILFVGYALDDPFFQLLFLTSIAPLDSHNPRCYAFGGQYSLPVQRFCDAYNIAIISTDLVEFLTDFIRALHEQLATPPATHAAFPPSPPPQRPYKYLLAYEAEDAVIFFGRQAEAEQLVSLIHAHRLVVLHGHSGVGKSSLLGAGVAPRLAANDYTVVTVRPLTSPVAAIRDRLAALLPDATLDAEAGLVALLAAAAAAWQKTLVIVLDQFEEFFLRHPPTVRDAFADALAQALEQRDLPVKWVLVLRLENLSDLSELRRVVPDVFAAELRLLALDAGGATEAIVRPAEAVGMSVAPALVARLLADLGPAPFEPPPLQIVCDALYGAARQNNEQHLTLSRYVGLGGAKRLLKDYLDRALNRLPADQAGQARPVLAALVSSRETPEILTAPQLAAETGLGEEMLLPLLRRLTGERLLKVTRRAGQPPTYELAHTYLAQTLALDPDTLFQKALRASLQRDVDNWEWFGDLVSAERLQTVRENASSISLPAEIRAFLFRSAIQRDHDIAYWAGQPAPQDASHIIEAHLAGDGAAGARPMVALTAIPHLANGQRFAPQLRLLILDTNAGREVRQQAALSLAELDPVGALAFLRGAPPEARRLALEALVHLDSARRSGRVNADWSPTWSERRAVSAYGLRTNAVYLLARAGVAGMAAIPGGLLAGLLLASTVDRQIYFVFGSVFVPFVWAASLLLGISLAEAVALNQDLPTRIIGGVIIGGLLMVPLAADPDLQLVLLAFPLGIIAVLLSSCALAITFLLAGAAAGRQRWLTHTAGGAITGLLMSLAVSPLASLTGIAGFGPLHLSAIMALGGTTMALGLGLAPTPLFRT